jgi:malate dehydrogenase (oxaloacetate-decarboxylating)
VSKEHEALTLHEAFQGKLEVTSKKKLTPTNLGLLYTPGVAEPCKKIAENIEDVYRYTNKGNFVAVISNGTAVLGLGDIGPEAGMPVMEGKSILFKAMANLDAFPICIKAQSADDIVRIVEALEPTFGGINLEDIAAPICFEAETRLKKSMNIPVFHDDQHGTAIVVLAGLTNALRLIGKKIENVKAVINGSGAAGTAIGNILLDANIGDLVMCDKQGILDPEDETLNPFMLDIARRTNKTRQKGQLADAIKGADIFIGVSQPNLVSPEMVQSMNSDAIVFALANPVMEINPVVAKQAGARVVASGSSNYPNQVNNLLAFPGILRGAMDVKARDINEAMKQAAAKAIADIIKPEELREDYVIPNPFDIRVVPAVAQAVAQAAIDSGIARNPISPEKIYLDMYKWLSNYFNK